MGQEENKTTIVQITEKAKKRYLKNIIFDYLLISKSLMEYYHAVATTRKAKITCTRSIKKIEQAMVFIGQIKHIEVLEYLYSTFIGNNVIAYSISGSVVLSPKIKEWDTDNGIEELKQLVEENRKKAEETAKLKREQDEAIAKAKAEGKKVEMVWDKNTKTAKPMIIEEKPTA